VADSFYEWKREGRNRTPMRIMLDSGELFAFAGLWEAWKRPDDSWMLSCAIVTTAANEMVADIHDRMPVILDPNVESVWLDPGIDNTAALSELLVPYPSELMTAYEVSRVVNSAANDVRECIAPIGRLL
jgi:putative SOS response-associated peptidase YedK